MSHITKGFEFGEFYLDTVERMLMRNGKPVSITPKSYQLLAFLLENAGTTLEKDTIMEAVWRDSFVEDGNLSFTIRLIRIALDDDAREPRYIETISRRGYRFIAAVTVIETEPLTKEPDDASAGLAETGKSELKPRTLSFPVIVFRSVLLLIVIAALLGIWYANERSAQVDAFPQNDRFGWSAISTNGTTSHVLLSPDGKNVIYVNGSGGRQSIWLRQLGSENNVEIIPPSEYRYGGLAFSPDGNFIYFTRFPLSDGPQLDIYRVSIFGGIPKKIVEGTQGWISVSPKGDTISFVRCLYEDSNYCAIWVADSEGNDQRMLTSRPRPIRISDNAISPDGEKVVFAAGQSNTNSNDFGLVEVDIRTGTERIATEEKFFNIRKVVWLAGQNGYLISASRVPVTNFRIWRIDNSTGDVQPMTDIRENFSSVSVDRSGNAIAATQTKYDFQIRLFDPSKTDIGPKVLADATSMAIANNGTIYFSSGMSGNNEIWTIQPDGTALKQLTSDKADDFRPIVSHNGRTVYFSSNRSGESHVWRINSDGSGLVKITDNESGFPVFASDDGEWVYFHHGRTRSLWRAHVAGIKEEPVIDVRSGRFTISPDGRFAAFPVTDAADRSLNIVELATKKPIRRFALTSDESRVSDLDWDPDGKSLIYILTNSLSGQSVVWRQPVAGGEPEQVRDLGTDEIGESSGLVYAPNGSFFCIIQGRWKHDAVVSLGLDPKP